MSKRPRSASLEGLGEVEAKLHRACKDTDTFQLSETLKSLTTFQTEIGSHPERFVSSDTKLRSRILPLLQSLYSLTKKNEAQPTKSLDKLLVDGFDAEQIWQEIRAQNYPLVHFFDKSIDLLIADLFNVGTSKPSASSDDSDDEEEEEEDEYSSIAQANDEEDDDEDESDDDDDDEEEEESEEEDEIIKNHSDEEEDDDSQADDDEETNFDDLQDVKDALEFEIDYDKDLYGKKTSDDDDEDDEKDFKFFIDELESSGKNNKKRARNKRNRDDILDNDDSDDLQEDEEEDDDEEEGEEALEDREFLPDEDAPLPKKNKRKPKNQREAALQQLDDDFFSLEEMERFADEGEREYALSKQDEDDLDIDGDEETDETKLLEEDEDHDRIFKKYRSKKFKEVAFMDEDEEGDDQDGEDADEDEDEDMGFDDDEDDEDEEDEDEEDEDEDEENAKDIKYEDFFDAPKSKYQLEKEKMKETISQLENKLVDDKGWQMAGEIASIRRPVDSLLTENVEFDHGVKVAPVITQEVTLSIEDLIKKRIKEESWDDVIRKKAPKKPKKKPTVELDFQKSKESLAELYEKDYLKEAGAFTEEVDEKKKNQHTEVMNVWKKLSFYLDSLSNFHFTPRPELDIIPDRPANAPSITIEEATPSATSEGSLLAPEEIYQRPKNLRSKEEMTSEERQALRRQRKSAKKKENKMREEEEKLVAKMNPGLGNKHSKERVLSEIRKSNPKKVQIGESTDSTKYSSSSSFFNKLQENVSNEISAKRSGDTKSRKKKKEEGSKGSQLKL